MSKSKPITYAEANDDGTVTVRVAGVKHTIDIDDATILVANIGQALNMIIQEANCEGRAPLVKQSRKKYTPNGLDIPLSEYN